LAVIAAAATGFGLGFIAAVGIGGATGIAFGTGVGAFVGGGTAGGGVAGTVVLSPAAAGALVGSVAGLGELILMAENANGPGTGGDGDEGVNRGDLKRVNSSDIQRWFKMDAHALKREILGAGAQISRYDIYRIGAEIVLLEKSTNILIRTGYMIPGF
jgi:hypothetical protein